MSTFRPATLADMPALLALSDILVSLDRAFDPSLDPEYSRSPEGRVWLEGYLSDPSACVLVVDDPSGTTVGMLIGRVDPVSPWRTVGPILGELEMFCVAPGLRGKGYGRGLLDAFASWARKHGAERLWVRVSSANADAIRFYRRELFTDYDVILERKL